MTEPVGTALAARVAAALEAGFRSYESCAIGDRGVYDHHVGLETGLEKDGWRERFGLRYRTGWSGVAFAVETASGKQEFSTAAAFVAWLAGQTDVSLAVTGPFPVTRRRLAAFTETDLPATRGPAAVLAQPGGLPAELVPLVESALESGQPVGQELAARTAARLEVLAGSLQAGVQDAYSAPGPYWGLWAGNAGLGFVPATGTFVHAPTPARWSVDGRSAHATAPVGRLAGLDVASATARFDREAFVAWLAEQTDASLGDCTRSGTGQPRVHGLRDGGLTRERLAAFAGPEQVPYDRVAMVLEAAGKAWTEATARPQMRAESSGGRARAGGAPWSLELRELWNRFTCRL